MSSLNKKERKVKLASRVRYKLRQRRNDRPRLSVFCSNGHIYAQVIDDIKGITLASASTLSADLKDLKKTSNIDAAIKVGKLVGANAKKAGISEVIFDRGDKLYHGKVKALADAAREALSF
ncbi:MAG: 50S ribosomal protein L18 [Rickettsiales bacterium]